MPFLTRRDLQMHVHEGQESDMFWDAMAEPSLDTAAHAASSFSPETSPEKPIKLHFASASLQAAKWREAQGQRCAVMWRIRALGRAHRRVECLVGHREDKYCGCPLQQR